MTSLLEFTAIRTAMRSLKCSRLSFLSSLFICFWNTFYLNYFLFFNLPLFSRSSSYDFSDLFCPWPPLLCFSTPLPYIHKRQFFPLNDLATYFCTFLFLPIPQISGVTSSSKTSFHRPFSYSVSKVLATCLANCNILTHTFYLLFPVQCTNGTRLLPRM